MAVIPKHNGERVYKNFDNSWNRSNWDVIVIGSGIGGMSCAAALAKKGKKVCVLEQHYIPGGYTHSFARKGYQWDAGVHALGEMKPGKLPFRVLEWLANGEIEMKSLGNPYDVFKMPGDEDFGLPDSRVEYFDLLKSKFPDQSDALDTYFSYIRLAAKGAMKYFALKTAPMWVDKIGTKADSIFNRNWWKYTTSEILDEAGITGVLRVYLTLHWGYIGTTPDESSFAMHALTVVHFYNGAYYPIGGSKVFAAKFLANVIENDGQVFTIAKVDKLIEEKGSVKGVTLSDGSKLFAPIVISAAGAKNTTRMISSASVSIEKWKERIQKIKSTPPYLCLNMGFKGDITKAGASTANMWLMERIDNSTYYWNVEDQNERPHILYISYPSLKDPLHDAGAEEKHTGECITFINWDSVSRWENTTEEDRPDDYVSFKKKIEERMLEVMRERIPDVMKHLDYYELSTPLTSEYYVGADQGAIYGLTGSPARFLSKDLKPKTPLNGLFMTGVDVGAIGVIGGMMAGIITASTIDKSILKQFLQK